MVVDLKINFHRHTDEPHDLSRESISSTDMSHTIHDQHLILVYVKLMAEMTGMVGDWVETAIGTAPTELLVSDLS